MDFNGMVRHYYLRQGAYYADIRVTIAERQRRSQQSHAILLRIRRNLEAIAESFNARIRLVLLDMSLVLVADWLTWKSR